MASCQCVLRFCQSMPLKYCACHEKLMPGQRSAAPVIQNHLGKPEDLMLRNATPLRKSGPWPPNISGEVAVVLVSRCPMCGRMSCQNLRVLTGGAQHDVSSSLATQATKHGTGAVAWCKVLKRRSILRTSGFFTFNWLRPGCVTLLAELSWLCPSCVSLFAGGCVCLTFRWGVWVVSGLCLGCVSLVAGVSGLCLGCVSVFAGVSGLCLSFRWGVWVVSGLCLGCVSLVAGVSGLCLGCVSVFAGVSGLCLSFRWGVWVVSWLCLGCVWVVSKLCLRCVWVVSRLCLCFVWVV